MNSRTLWEILNEKDEEKRRRMIDALPEKEKTSCLKEAEKLRKEAEKLCADGEKLRERK